MFSFFIGEENYDRAYPLADQTAEVWVTYAVLAEAIWLAKNAAAVIRSAAPLSWTESGGAAGRPGAGVLPAIWCRLNGEGVAAAEGGVETGEGGAGEEERECYQVKNWDILKIWKKKIKRCR